jgi:hypothetical protein
MDDGRPVDGSRDEKRRDETKVCEMSEACTMTMEWGKGKAGDFKYEQLVKAHRNPSFSIILPAWELGSGKVASSSSSSEGWV